MSSASTSKGSDYKPDADNFFDKDEIMDLQLQEHKPDMYNVILDVMPVIEVVQLTQVLYYPKRRFPT